MAKHYSVKRKSSVGFTAYKPQKSRHHKTITIRPMMPNGYTAVQRERLKAFEKSIMSK